MNLLTIAWKPIRHQSRSYAAYFLSSGFAVWLFYLYASLIFHPLFQGDAVAPSIRQIMLFLVGLVALFSVLFILYSHSAFLKARQRDLGLMTLLGLTPVQVAQVVHWENGIIGLGAMTTGIGLGVVSGKLFFLAVVRALQFSGEISFHLSAGALVLTVAVFGGVFTLVSLYGQLVLWRQPVAELIRGAARPMAQPRTSPWLGAAAAITLGLAYGIALTARGPEEMDERFLPYLGLLLVGTYLLFTQGTVALLRLLKRRPGIYYRNVNLMIIAQLVFKVRDHARILFIVSMLTTGVLIAAGLFYTSYRETEARAVQAMPTHLMLAESPTAFASTAARMPGAPPKAIPPGRVDQVLREEGVKVADSAHARLLQGGLQSGDRPISTPVGILALTEFNRWQQMLGRPPISLEPATITVLRSGGWASSAAVPRISVGGEPVELEVRLGSGPLGLNSSLLTYMVAIMEDSAFEKLHSEHSARWGGMLHGWQTEAWQSARPAVRKLYGEMGYPLVLGDGNSNRPLTATVIHFDTLKQGFGFMLILLTFVSLFFLLAAGNMVYFKLFTDAQDDRRQIQGLRKLGLRSDEAERMVTAQALTLYLVPFLVAMTHAAAAMQMLGMGIEYDVWHHLDEVMAVYLLLYLIYYLVARRSYAGVVLGRG